MRILIFLFIFMSLIGKAYAAACEPNNADNKRLIENAYWIQWAMKNSDFDTVINLTHPGLIADIGGKEKMVLALRNANKQLETLGVKLEDIKFEDPELLYKDNKHIVCVLRRVATYSVGNNTSKSIGFLITEKEVEQGDWKYFDGSGLRRNPHLFGKHFPYLPKDIKLPRNENVIEQKG